MTSRARVASAPVVALLLLAACTRERSEDDARQREGTSVTLPAGVRPTPALPSRFATLGRVASAAEIQVWDIDANPAGRGLPAGRGTYAEGAAIFLQKCASCHGVHGEGLGAYPKLVGRVPGDSFPFGQDFKYPKTIGNYWPYSTTVFDYIRRAMPLNAPGSLRSNEIYSVVAFLLAENGIVDRSSVMDARTLPAVKMPARDRFVPDDRQGGAVFH
jgi:cytochrome c